MDPLQKFCAAITLWIFSQFALAETVHIAAAANFAAPVKAIINAFESTTGHSAVLSLGSSGKFYAQILHGAPFDVFFSADQEKPEELERRNKTVQGSRRTYAVGRLVLWSTQKDLIDNSPAILDSGHFSKLAIANPRLAPYGAAAVEVLEALSLRAQTEPKWVRGENISQTYQFVSTGNADLGFVARSQLISATAIQRGSQWLVPDHYHRPIRQDVVQLKRAEGNEAAEALLIFIKTPGAREIIESYGYTTSN